jgi:hypothetical protein
MKLPHFFLFIGLFFINSVCARELNYIEAHNLRLSSHAHPLHWINSFVFNKNPGNYESNIFVSSQKDVQKLYNDVQSKDQNKIIARLNESFGEPYDLSAKVNFGFKKDNWSQFFSTNGGAVLLVTDPVFPDLKGFIFHDYTSTTAYLYKPTPALVIKPQISVGVRKILDRTLSTGDLVSESLDVKFNKAPYVGFTELGLLSTYNTFGYGHLIFELTSLPLMSSDYQYWETFIGYKTINIAKKFNWKISELSFYGGYAPVYAGKYDVSRTIKLGSRIGLMDELDLDLFTTDELYPGALLSYTFKYFELALFTFERAYDDFGRQKSRQFGGNLKFAW